MRNIEKIGWDTRQEAAALSPAEARYLATAYLRSQREYEQAEAKRKMLERQKEPNATVSWYAKQHSSLAYGLELSLKVYASAHLAGAWLLSINGMTPALAAGLLANIDIMKTDTAGGLWRYAGLDPSQGRGPGKSRHGWNEDLKLVCVRLGDAFAATTGKPNSPYGQAYVARYRYEKEQNASGAYEEQAKRAIKDRSIKRDRNDRLAYDKGRLPNEHLESRAKRWAVKLFLSHLHEALYLLHHDKLPPAPYPLAQQEHETYLGIPNAELVPGWLEVRANVLE